MSNAEENHVTESHFPIEPIISKTHLASYSATGPTCYRRDIEGCALTCIADA
jgi:hypothetical protein